MMYYSSDFIPMVLDENSQFEFCNVDFYKCWFDLPNICEFLYEYKDMLVFKKLSSFRIYFMIPILFISSRDGSGIYGVFTENLQILSGFCSHEYIENELCIRSFVQPLGDNSFYIRVWYNYDTSYCFCRYV